jgi:hypothetical protein
MLFYILKADPYFDIESFTNTGVSIQTSVGGCEDKTATFPLYLEATSCIGKGETQASLSAPER